MGPAGYLFYVKSIELGPPLLPDTKIVIVLEKINYLFHYLAISDTRSFSIIHFVPYNLNALVNPIAVYS